VIGWTLHSRRELRKVCLTKGAHFDSWLDYVRDLIEFHGRNSRIAYQAAMHNVEHALHFCDWRLWAMSVGGQPEGVRIVHFCRKAIGHTGAHSPITPSTLYCSLWWRGTEPPPPIAFPPPRLKNCRCILVTEGRSPLTGLAAMLNGATVSTELTPEAAPGIEAIFDAVQESRPELNTARGGLSPERLERLNTPDPRAYESPMNRKGKK
jgi:hypothetical protein